MSGHEPREAHVRLQPQLLLLVLLLLLLLLLLPHNAICSGMANVLKAGGARVVSIDPGQRSLSVQCASLCSRLSRISRLQGCAHYALVLRPAKQGATRDSARVTCDV